MVDWHNTYAEAMAAEEAGHFTMAAKLYERADAQRDYDDDEADEEDE